MNNVGCIVNFNDGDKYFVPVENGEPDWEVLLDFVNTGRWMDESYTHDEVRNKSTWFILPTNFGKV